MRSVAAIIVALLLSVVPSGAHVAIPTEFRDVVSDASLIVRGRVTDVRSVSEPGRGIESIATVAVESVLKGTANSFVYVRVPGGEVGRRRVVMTGAPQFKAGQRAVFFLRPSAMDSSHRPVGLSLGVYRLQAEAATGRTLVAPPVVAGVTSASRGPVQRGDVRRQMMAVPEFEALVRLVMATPTGQAVRRGGGR